MKVNAGGYELLDSGGGAKLERFGEYTLVRPSSLAVWRRRLPTSAWKEAAAVYDHDAGWSFARGKIESWTMEVNGLELTLRIQKNGLIGFFPEHASYLPDLERTVSELGRQGGEPAHVLNLFAYTGMATVAALRAGARVTHLDLAKHALDWADENAGRNDVRGDRLRLIRDDSFTFLKREAKRGRRYQIVMLDPPSFSRIEKGKSWKLEEIVADVVSAVVDVLDPERGAVFFTSHHTEMGPLVVANLFFDHLNDRGLAISHRHLSINEADGKRALPAGHLVFVRYG